MKTLQEIKNHYAQEQGYEDWESIRNKPGYVVESHMDEICIRAQKEALEKASENAWVQMDLQTDWYGVDRTSITNPENLIR